MCTTLEKTKKQNDAATRNADAARTLDGRIPIDRPYVWICPRRPAVATQGNDVDNASQRYYCPECDWSDYYCLCSTLKAVGPCDRRLLALEKQREEETGLVGYTVDRRSAGGRGQQRQQQQQPEQQTVLCRTTWPDVDDGAPVAGRRTLQPAGRRVGAGEGGALAVDEGGDGRSTEQTLEGAQSMATTGQRDDADGSDAGGSCHRRTRDVLLRVEDLVNAGCEDDNEAEFDDDEELELFLKAYDEGQVRICCEWTAAPLTSERLDGGDGEPYQRKVAVWRRPWAEATEPRVRRRQEEARSSDDDDDAMDDDDDEDLTRALDDWEEKEAIAKAVDCAIVEQQQQEEQRQQPDSPPPPPPKEDWKTPRNAILYTTRRWELVPRASKRLEAKEHARWVARMQEAIDAEDEWERTSRELGIDDKIAELRARKEREAKAKRTAAKEARRTTTKAKMSPRSRLLATGWERGTACSSRFATIDFE